MLLALQGNVIGTPCFPQTLPFYNENAILSFIYYMNMARN